MFIGWFDCRTSVDLRAHTSSCTDKPSMQDCTEGKKKKKKTLKHVVKRLTPFWVTHTQRYDTSPLAVCASSAPHTSCDCFTTRKKFIWTEARIEAVKNSDSFKQPNKHSVHCLCWYDFSLMKWSNSESLCGLILCLCADVTYGCN